MDNLRPTEPDSPLNRRVRAFLGIGPAPEDWAEALGNWTSQLLQLGRFGSPIKWVPPENLHLTLRFFGSISQRDVLEVTERVRAVAANHSPFVLQTTNLALFPTPARLRICAVTMDEPTGELKKLEQSIRAQTSTFGLAAEKREFHPHVTFGRIRDSNSAGLNIIRELWRERSLPELPAWKVKEVTLFMSQTQGGGPVYSSLGVFPLAPR